MIIYNTAEGVKTGIIIKFYSCGYRYLTCESRLITRIVDHQQVIYPTLNQTKRTS